MSKPGDFDAVRKDIAAILKNPKYDDGSIGPVLVRLAWHSSGTYCKETDTGGSNGAGMRYEKEGGDPANAGLQHARVFLEPIKKKHSWITYSDLWTLAGVVAIKAMGGPDIEWKGGRSDFADDSLTPPNGRLPDAAQAQDHLRNIFYRMGFNDQEIVALSGAHNLGRCHTQNSGFDGKWVNNPTRFSNQYFKLLKKLKWEKKQLPKESADKGAVWQWVARTPTMEDDEPPLMMLPTDYSLTQDAEFNKYVEIYAEDAERFFKDFSAVFAKLIELGVYRDPSTGIAKVGAKAADYKSAPKKSDTPGAAGHGDAEAKGASQVPRPKL